MPGKVRIIAGTWRSRRIEVADVPGLRPTPDRVRETLFNWLQPYIPGASCLDLYAGSGILGFEALSRGASSAVMVEHNRTLANAMERQAGLLGATDARIVCADAGDWLRGCRDKYDIIFLDPPYSANQTGNNIRQLINCNCMNEGSLLYVESDHEPEDMDPRLKEFRSGKAGIVQFRLLKLGREEK